jgi:quercetin dioxygenase-like cupin family protein
MEGFELDALEKEHVSLGKLYLEFLHIPALSMGLYVLPAGGTDPQSPHTEDEVYYVVSGEAVISVGDEEREVRPGSIIYVAANVPHRFHMIRSELRVLVFFAPAEYSAG